MHKFGHNAEKSSCRRAEPACENWIRSDGIHRAVKQEIMLMLCLFFLAFTKLVSPPWCSSLSVTDWHLPAAKAYTDSLGLQSWLEYEAGFCYEMCHEKCWKLKWESWEISCDPINAMNKQTHKSLFLIWNFIRLCLVGAKEFWRNNDEKNMKWP